MLNRRILRIKAFKTIYSFAENPSMSLKEAEVQLERSCESTRDLYLFMLSVIIPLTAEAGARAEAAKSKFNPTEEELHPNLKFISNRIAPILESDPDFIKMLSKKHLSWEQYDAFIRHLYASIREKDYFKSYMESGESTLAEDAGLWVKIFETEFEDNAELESILEDISIWWNDDLCYSLSWCCRTMDGFAKGKAWSLPPLYMSDMAVDSKESDKAFVTGIVRAAVLNFEEMVKSISELTPKWDSNRICTTDLALIVSGLAEHKANPFLPSRIIINEFVEISKFYSTPESRGFVNGLLDKLINKQS